MSDGGSEGVAEGLWLGPSLGVGELGPDGGAWLGTVAGLVAEGVAERSGRWSGAPAPPAGAAGADGP
ncbi:MAG: hypothetical protein ACRDT6_23950, partial [Micromonosporaceae bacterium]